ncbi:MAG TPA: hypothetical protein VGF44_05625 [Terriglobales bacterium]
MVPPAEATYPRKAQQRIVHILKLSRMQRALLRFAGFAVLFISFISLNAFAQKPANQLAPLNADAKNIEAKNNNDSKNFDSKNIDAKSNDAPNTNAPNVDAPSTYITSRQRFQWFVTSSVGPTSLAAGLFTAAFGTARNTPKEYGPHWEGYGKRYAMRFTGIATSNAMEAGLGALWGEDPRYFRDANDPIKARIDHAILTTFTARNRQGETMPAYARFIAIPGNNFLSNTWRADSEANTKSAAIRSVYGVLGKMGGNAFAEFWPDLKRLAFHHGN